MIKKAINKLWPLFVCGLLFIHEAGAASIGPDTSAVMIDELDKEGTIGIKNTEDKPILLYSKVVRLEDDPIDGALIPIPAAVIVQPGETQIVRLLFRSNGKLTQEHMARVIFTGIPQKEDAPGRVKLLIGHDLPIIIRPTGQPVVNDRWRYLKWRASADRLCVYNDSKMVIRYVNTVSLLPSQAVVTLPKPYSLPNSQNCGPLPEGFKPAADMKVQFTAMSAYSYILNDLQAPLSDGNIPPDPTTKTH